MGEIEVYLSAIVPTIGVAVLFYFIIRAMMEGDRRERLAQSRLEAEQDRAAAGGTDDVRDAGLPAAPQDSATEHPDRPDSRKNPEE